jgi:hypothetical protein
MTPKEKALELCQKFGYTTIFTDCNEGYTLPLEISKKCALISVNEIIKEVPAEILGTYKGKTQFIISDNHKYWQEVKQEIEKL